MTRRLFLLTGLLVAMATTANAQQREEALQWPTPRPEAKAGTRWWWLGSAVDRENLRWNLSEYARTGIGAVEITPLYGVQGNDRNNIPFLSPQWMEALRTVEDIGRETGIQIDMNCGTGWPFGGPTVKIAEAAGKLVTKTDVLTADGTTQLTFGVGSPEANATLSKVMAYKDDEAVDVTAYIEGSTLRWTAPAGEWRIIAVYNGHTLQQVKRAAPGGEGWVIDHFDREAVKHYLDRFEQAFAQSGVPYPNTFFNDSYEVYKANWTPTLFDEFLKRRGYDLRQHLPELLGVADDGNQVLCDYRETLSDLLLENFTRQWVGWAHKHGVQVRNQAHGSPGNLLDLYGVVDIPEIEGFGLSEFGIRGLRTDPGKTRRNYSDLSMLKYASSASHTGGKPLASCETFTWLTEHFRTSLSQFKPDLDLIFCAGINRVFFHGTCYSPVDDPWPGWKFYASGVTPRSSRNIWNAARVSFNGASRTMTSLSICRSTTCGSAAKRACL